MRTRTTVVLPLALALTGLTLAATPASFARVDETTKPRATTMAAGASHTVMIDGAGQIWGVGSSADGQLGTTGTVTSLRKISGLPAGVRATAVDAGPDFTLVLGSNGVVYGTGTNADGQLTGAGGADVTALRPLTGLPAGVKGGAISAGTGFSLVVGSNGTVYGTGRNDHSQLTGAATSRTTLAPLTGLPADRKAKGVDAGAGFSVVFDDKGKVYGAGSNAAYQLALPSTADATTLTGLVGVPDGATTAVAAGADSTAVLQGGQVLTVGAGSATVVTNAPTGVVSVAANPQSSRVVIVRDDGRSYTAAASATTYTALTEPSDLDKIVEVAAGATTVLARDARGVVYSTTSGGQALTLQAGQQFSAPDRPSFLTGATVSAGDEISANSATWIPSDIGASSFQWLRNGVEIAGATNEIYTVTTADQNSKLSVRETRAFGGFETGVGESEAVNVAGATLRAVKMPTATGSGRVGSTLTARDANFEPQQEDLTRVWLRNGGVIPGATGPTYKVTTADAGKAIAVRSIGIKPGFINGLSVSNAVKVAIQNTARPRVAGTAKVGKRLTMSSKGTWYGASTLTYQWYRGTSRISGATKTSYKLTKKDRKKKIGVRVSAKRPGYATVTVASSTTRAVR